MIHDWKMELYWRLPVWGQEVLLDCYAANLDRRYYGGDYDDWRKRFLQWRNWSRSDAESWQNEQLQSIVEIAATRVPYYRDRWRNLDWRSVRSVGALALLPTLDKQSIRQNEDVFLAEGLNRRTLWIEKTSGTTGTALRIFWPMSMLPKWWALFEVMVRNTAGVAREIPRAMLGGRSIVRGAARKPPFWRYNRRWQQLYLSSYHVSRGTARFYTEAIQHYGSEWITGYGSAIAALAESALGSGIAPLPLRCAVVSGDTLLPLMRSSIESYFECRCFDSYGQCEGVAMAMECSHGNMHVIPQAGIVEILREDGSPCAPGEVGELVGTTTLNDAMPLIRYRLGDYAAWGVERACSCGNRQAVITDLRGRVDDYLVASDGTRIGRLSTAVKRSPSIHSAQIVQDRPGHAYLLVRPSGNYKSDDARAVCDDIIERIGPFKLEVIEVEDIPRTRQGKTALVVRLGEMAGTEAYESILNNRNRHASGKVA